MRWLIVHPGPNFSVADVHDGWAEALRGLGEHVIEYNLDRRLTFYDSVLMPEDMRTEEGRQAVRKALTREQAIELAANGVLSACYQTWPDVVMFVSAFFVPGHLLEVIRARRHRVVMLFTEAPYQTGQQLEMAEFADLALLNDPTGIEEYRAITRAEYMPHAYRPTVHYPAVAGTPAEWDMAFVGTGFPSRVRFFEQMNLTGLDVRLAGPWLTLPEDSPLRDWTATKLDDCVDNADTAGIYRRAATGINFYRREGDEAHDAQGWAVGPREVEMAACGLWFARDPRPESDELFPMLPAFTSAAEAGDMIRWALAHPEDRAEAAAKARAAVEGRTFENHARKLLAMLDH
jgi:hypothetical protein